MQRTGRAAGVFLGLLISPLSALAQTSEADQAAFRAIYKEMVETDTSPTTGSCTRLVRLVEGHLRSAGFSADEFEVIIPPGRPDDGNIVARIKAKSSDKKGVLLLGHIDVVDARREDWERDPFTLFEENGFFFGRGVADMKGQAAIWLDLMMRLKQEPGFTPSRDLILGLTCGEETSDRTNGVDYILTHHKDWFDVAFALNEGAGGLLSEDGRPLVLQIQAGEKIHQVFELEVTNPGGHSSRPTEENAIYRLMKATGMVSRLSFPVQLTSVTREYFRITGPILGGEIGSAMSVIAGDPDNRGAIATLLNDPTYNALLRTTCVATQLDAGHAPNALPQRARAVLSCRVMQGTTPEQVKAMLEEAIRDGEVKVSIVRRREGSSAPELNGEILGPVREQAGALWPGVPVAPIMIAGATDGRFLMAAGIPTYGLSGVFSVSGETNAHGLNEKVRVRSLYEAREFLEGVVRAYLR